MEVSAEAHEMVAVSLLAAILNGKVSIQWGYRIPMDTWFLNELLRNPRFWATIRTFVRLNQAEFGKEVGVSRQLVSRWETELSIPTRSHTIKAQVVLERHLQKTLERMRGELEGEFEEAATL